MPDRNAEQPETDREAPDRKRTLRRLHGGGSGKHRAGVGRKLRDAARAREAALDSEAP